MNELDVFIPVGIDHDWQTKETIIEEILEQYQSYGFKKFALCAPGPGWRGIGFPPEDFYKEKALFFKEIKEALVPHGIECGWWNTLTVKSGRTEGFQPIVKSDGSEHPFANCPLDEAFKKRFARSNALFAKIAKPAFILTEDDYSLSAAAGCFCDLHLQEFERRHGLGLSRERLVEILKERTPEAIEVIKKWRALMRDTMVDLSVAVRIELDKDSPEIPMGHAQPGGADSDGDCSLPMAKALAGPHHTPFSRLYGAFYNGFSSRRMPRMLYHMLYCRQHYGESFKYYMEADAFPHTRFFTTGCQMMASIAVALSWGLDGVQLYTRQILDGGNEESDVYGKSFAKNRACFEELRRKVALCNVKGVEIAYDPFWDSLERNKDGRYSSWLTAVSRFGIPFSTLESSAVFLEERQARYFTESQVKAVLQKNVFMDSVTAKVLCERGYGKYLGVSVGDDVTEGNRLQWDLCSREVIRPAFAGKLKGTHMSAPWLMSGAKLYAMSITDEKCEIISYYYSFDQRLVTPAMTYYQNELGGRIIVMGMTVEDNHGQALLNYRRKHLLQSLLPDEYVVVKDAPDIMIIENETKNRSADFRELLTLVNLCEDTVDSVKLHLPAHLADLKEIVLMNRQGEWEPVSFERVSDGAVINQPLAYCDPMYLLLK